MSYTASHTRSVPASSIVNHQDRNDQQPDDAGARFSKLRGRSSIPSAAVPSEQQQQQVLSVAVPSQIHPSQASPEEPLSPWLNELLKEIEADDSMPKENKHQSSMGTDTFADQFGDVNEVNSKWFSMLLAEVRKSLAEEMQSWGQKVDSNNDSEDETVRVFINECSIGRIEGLQRAAKNKRNQRRLRSNSIPQSSHIAHTPSVPTSSSSHLPLNVPANDILSKKFPNAAAKLFEFSTSAFQPNHDISTMPSPHRNLLLTRRSRIARKDALKRELGAERRMTNLILKATKLREENHWKFIRGLVALEGKMRQKGHGSLHEMVPSQKISENFDDIVNSDENPEDIFATNEALRAVPDGRASESSKNFSTMSTSGGEDLEEEDEKFLSPLPQNVTQQNNVKSGNDSQYDGDASSAAAQGAPRQPSSVLIYPSPLNRVSEEMSEMPMWVNINNASALLSGDDNNKRSLQEFIQHSGAQIPPALEKKEDAIEDEEGMCVINMASPLSGDMDAMNGCHIPHEKTAPYIDDWNEAASPDFDFDEEHIRNKVRSMSMRGQNPVDDESFDEDEEAEKLYQAQLQQLRLVQSRRIEAEEAEAELRNSQRANSRVNQTQQELYRSINHEIKAAVAKLNRVPQTEWQPMALDDDSDFYESGMVADIDEGIDAGPLAGWDYDDSDDEGDLDLNNYVPEDEYYHSNTFERIQDDQNESESDINDDITAADIPAQGINKSSAPLDNDEVQIGSDFGLDEQGIPEPQVHDAYMINPEQNHCPPLPRTPPAVSDIESGNNSTDVADEIERMNKLNAIVEKRIRSPAAILNEPVILHTLEPIVVGKDGIFRTLDTHMGETNMYILQSKLLRNKIQRQNNHFDSVMPLMTSEPLFTTCEDESDAAEYALFSPNEVKEMKEVSIPNHPKERKSDIHIDGRTVQSQSIIPDPILPALIPPKPEKVQRQNKIHHDPHEEHSFQKLQMRRGQNLNNHRKVPPVPHSTQVKPRNKKHKVDNKGVQPFAAPRDASSNGVITVPLLNFHPNFETVDWLLIGTSRFPSSFSLLREAEDFDTDKNQTIDMLVVDPFEALNHRRSTLVANRDSRRQEIAAEKGREILAARTRKLRNIHLVKACAHRHIKKLRAEGKQEISAKDQEDTIINQRVSRRAPGANNDEVPLPQPSEDMKKEQEAQDLHASSGDEDARPTSWLSKAIAAVAAVTHAFTHKKEDNEEKDAEEDSKKFLTPFSPQPEENEKNSRKLNDSVIDVFPEKSGLKFSSGMIGKHFPRTRARMLAQHQLWEAASRLPPIKQSLSIIIDGDSKKEKDVDKQKESSKLDQEAPKETNDYFSALFGGETKKEASQFDGTQAYAKSLMNAVRQFRSRVIANIDSDRLLVADHLRHSFLRDRARSLRIKLDNAATHISDAKKESQLDHEIDHAVYLLDLKMANYRREQFLEKRKDLLKNDRYRQMKVSEARKKADDEKALKQEEFQQKLNEAADRHDSILQSRVDLLAAQEAVRQERTAVNLTTQNIMSSDSE